MVSLKYMSLDEIKQILTGGREFYKKQNLTHLDLSENLLEQTENLIQNLDKYIERIKAQPSMKLNIH